MIIFFWSFSAKFDTFYDVFVKNYVKNIKTWWCSILVSWKRFFFKSKLQLKAFQQKLLITNKNHVATNGGLDATYSWVSYTRALRNSLLSLRDPHKASINNGVKDESEIRLKFMRFSEFAEKDFSFSCGTHFSHSHWTLVWTSANINFIISISTCRNSTRSDPSIARWLPSEFILFRFQHFKILYENFKTVVGYNSLLLIIFNEYDNTEPWLTNITRFFRWNYFCRQINPSVESFANIYRWSIGVFSTNYRFFPQLTRHTSFRPLDN